MVKDLQRGGNHMPLRADSMQQTGDIIYRTEGKMYCRNYKNSDREELNHPP